ncbi:hypothetical protein [Pelagibacterium sediminicola]|uniref:hypothetical protein n=1 Tax=Pelagibacterium sediminicola TaxID=2248761 RepID=UPI001300B5EA|nr:hypothetical protein [Pelagibacterium sediminicola]
MKSDTPLVTMREDERVCFDRAMDQWLASTKRPDLSEQDRVKGALLAYQRQAFVFHEKALLEAHQRGQQRAVDWHRKNARICREIAQDDPRINETDRKRAGQAAIQHDASATGIEAMMIEDRRAKAQGADQ